MPVSQGNYLKPVKRETDRWHSAHDEVLVIAAGNVRIYGLIDFASQVNAIHFLNMDVLDLR